MISEPAFAVGQSIPAMAENVDMIHKPERHRRIGVRQAAFDHDKIGVALASDADELALGVGALEDISPSVPTKVRGRRFVAMNAPFGVGAVLDRESFGGLSGLGDNQENGGRQHCGARSYRDAFNLGSTLRNDPAASIHFRRPLQLSQPRTTPADIR